jgi:hypothetical protein
MNPNYPSPSPLLTRKQVARRWGVCCHTVMRYKALSPIKLGSRFVRYRLEDVLQIENDASSTPEKPKPMTTGQVALTVPLKDIFHPSDLPLDTPSEAAQSLDRFLTGESDSPQPIDPKPNPAYAQPVRSGQLPEHGAVPGTTPDDPF